MDLTFLQFRPLEHIKCMYNGLHNYREKIINISCLEYVNNTFLEVTSQWAGLMLHSVR